MILFCGIPSETPLARVREHLDRQGIPYVMFNQRQFARMEMSYTLQGGAVTGQLRIGEARYRLEEFRGVYIRLMDDGALPELHAEPPGSPLRQQCRALHDTLTRWCEVTPARVVNRTAAMGSNFSKPYQIQLIRRHGFSVPDTLVTNDPEEALAFREKHGRVIYKSISGIRSIVQTLEEADLPRLARIRYCPTQFQQYVPGTNLRVHVIGQEVIATAIDSDVTDYRYAQSQGGEANLREVELSDAWAQRCIELTESLGLAFAGIDLKVTPEHDAYCFEVNPSPAYSYYESHTGQPISEILAQYLAGE